METQKADTIIVINFAQTKYRAWPACGSWNSPPALRRRPAQRKETAAFVPQLVGFEAIFAFCAKRVVQCDYRGNLAVGWSAHPRIAPHFGDGKSDRPRRRRALGAQVRRACLPASRERPDGRCLRRLRTCRGRHSWGADPSAVEGGARSGSLEHRGRAFPRVSAPALPCSADGRLLPWRRR